MNKRGQFYIVAAIIIVLILAGITSVQTYAIVRPEPRVIQDLGSELTEETSRIVDYGIYQSKDLSALLGNFTAKEFAPYFLQKTDETGIMFIYGNKTDLTAVRYDEKYTGKVIATIGSGVSTWETTEMYDEMISVDPAVDPINVTILNRTFNFDLQDNQMFYFVVVQEKDGETYVETNK